MLWFMFSIFNRFSLFVMFCVFGLLTVAMLIAPADLVLLVLFSSSVVVSFSRRRDR